MALLAQESAEASKAVASMKGKGITGMALV